MLYVTSTYIFRVVFVLCFIVYAAVAGGQAFRRPDEHAETEEDLFVDTAGALCDKVHHEDESRHDIITMLQGRHVCVKNGGWTSVANDMYNSLTATLINDQFELENTNSQLREVHRDNDRYSTGR